MLSRRTILIAAFILATATIPADRNAWGPWTELVIRNEKVLLDAFEAMVLPRRATGS